MKRRYEICEIYKDSIIEHIIDNNENVRKALWKFLDTNYFSVGSILNNDGGSIDNVASSEEDGNSQYLYLYDIGVINVNDQEKIEHTLLKELNERKRFLRECDSDYENIENSMMVVLYHTIIDEFNCQKSFFREFSYGARYERNISFVKYQLDKFIEIGGINKKKKLSDKE
jgi:hypothetical protein